jgi:hypothetical protein
LTWQKGITRALVRQRDLWGRGTARWTVIRTSNAYVFRDPQQQFAGVPVAQVRKSGRNINQVDSMSLLAPAVDPDSPLERALARFGAAVAAKDGIEQAAGG